MESASKRKAASGAALEMDGRPPKRQKLPGDTDASSETVATTTTMGLKFLDSLRAAKDKTGRPISTHFLTLPNKDEIPDYYEHIKLPVAIDTIEAKLNNGEYVSLAQVESDCKRLVNNAKAYNDKNNIIYQDAERLRKTASNWMVKHNPAYRDSKYVAQATPVPGEENTPVSKPLPRPAARPTPRSVPRVRATTPKPATPTPAASTETNTTTERPRRAAAAPQLATPVPAPPPSRSRKSAAPEHKEEDGSPDFTGKTFQQAQDQIIREMIDYQDPGSELQIFQPFLNLPTRALKDYYQVIKQPMSLSAVQKKVRGVIGRNPPTGFTELKSWNAFEEDMSLIWTNAQIYNEDGSDIYNLANELKDVFLKRLAEAKAKVEEPPQPKLKLNMSTAPKQQLKLKLRQSPGPGSDPNTPAGRSSATPSFIVDNEALQRQQKHVQESMNGTRASRPSSSGRVQTPSASTNPFTGSSRNAAVSIAPLTTAQAKVAASPPATNGIKHDVQSPALNSIRPASTATNSHQRASFHQQVPMPIMPPPIASARTMSGSPHPNGPIGHQTGLYPQISAPNHYVPPTTPQFADFRQTPLQSSSEALLPKIVLSAHPALNLKKPFSLNILANKEKTTHSVTLHLPASHSYLQIVPHIPVALTNRAYRLFVIVNNNRILEVNRVPVTAGINGSGMDSKKKGEPVFEAKMVPGVNRIEVHIIAERDRRPGKPEPKDSKDQVELEKCLIFANLMKAS